MGTKQPRVVEGEVVSAGGALVRRAGGTALSKRDPLEMFAKDKAPHTHRAYEKDVHEFLAFAGIDRADRQALREVSPALVVEWISYVSKRDEAGTLLNAATVARKLSALRAVFAWLRSCGVMETNPAMLVKAPRVSAQSPRLGLSRAEARALVEAVSGDTTKAKRDRAILLVCLFGGLRRAEVAALRMGDLYEERGHMVLHVRGKGGKTRKVPLKPEAFRSVQEYLQTAGRTGTDAESSLFVPTCNRRTKRTDKPMSPAMIWHIVTAAVKKAGIEKRISPHSLRHTAITLALDGGAKVERVQAFAGHADPKTTIRYFRSAEDLDQSAAHQVNF